MRPRLLLLAFCAGVIHGQNEPALVGLPEVGVTLTGTAEHPEIVNSSGRIILAYIIWQKDPNGHGPLEQVLKTRDLRLALIRPASASAPTATPPQSNSIYTFFSVGVKRGTIIQAVLQAVIFGDGQLIGMDTGDDFDMLSAQIDGERTLAQSVSGKKTSWDELQALFTRWRNERPTPGSIAASAREAAQMILAADLLRIRRGSGEAAALQIADWSSKLPVLWKAK